ncbi:MAG: alkaline phosphatase D family protein [Rhodospirillaceae bacterium]|nr:alkaline phosphatase D family protein [Rhodospirillaceae bacterium]
MLGRRRLIAGVGAATAGLTAARTAPVAAGAATPVRFTHGVASGDPLQTAVVIWTRAVADTPNRVAVNWDVSDTETFAAIVRSGTATTDGSRDYTVKVDVTGLEPGRTYYYRFKAGDAVSQIGRTRTFPASGQGPLKFAVFCCANVGQGFFNVYRHCAERDDIDVCLHIGDYIYEYPPSDPTAEEMARGIRRAEPPKKLVTLADYRLRYGSYRVDPDLQEVHRRHPFIVAWDDHEIANNAHKNGSENHWPSVEGTWEQRKASAIKAYFEWMPIRPIDPDPSGRIFRSFDFGDVASIIMLDTRLAGRERGPGGSSMIFLTEPSPDGTQQWAMPYDWRVDPPVPRPDLFVQVGGDAEKLPAGHIFMPDFERYRNEVVNAERTILGDEQEAWLTETLKASKARGAAWQILGQQTITATFISIDPTPHMDPARAGRFTPDFFRQRRLQDRANLPFASDTWGGGYPKARDRMIEALRRHANNTIILSGDLHNAWGFVHHDSAGEMRAFEVTTASVTSPGMESFMGTNGPSMVRGMMQRNSNIVYGELSSRGYAVVALTREAADVEWVFVDTVWSKAFTAKVDKRLRIAARTATSPMQVMAADEEAMARSPEPAGASRDSAKQRGL